MSSLHSRVAAVTGQALGEEGHVDFRSSLRVIDPPVDGALRYLTTYMVLKEQSSVNNEGTSYA